MTATELPPTLTDPPLDPLQLLDLHQNLWVNKVANVPSRTPKSRIEADGLWPTMFVGESLGLLQFHDDTAAPERPRSPKRARCAASSWTPRDIRVLWKVGRLRRKAEDSPRGALPPCHPPGAHQRIGDGDHGDATVRRAPATKIRDSRRIHAKNTILESAFCPRRCQDVGTTPHPRRREQNAGQDYTQPRLQGPIFRL